MNQIIDGKIHVMYGISILIVIDNINAQQIILD